jgi:hypothetical protein
MRIVPFVLVLLLTGCGGFHSAPGAGEQSATLPPAMGNDALRDGFYDGGIYDPDQSPRAMRLPE